MDPETTILPPVTLPRLCETVVRNHSGKWPPGEDTLAQEFVSFFQIHGSLKLEDLERLCRTLGVEVSVQDLPKGLRGHNHAYQDKREIVIGTVPEAVAAIGSREHTLLHELRELMEYEFRKMEHPIVASFPDGETRAESFAGFVRTLAVMKGWQPLFEGMGDIKSGWGLFGMFLLAFLLIAGCSFACLALPNWEDRLQS